MIYQLFNNIYLQTGAWEHLGGGTAMQNATQTGAANFQQGIQANQAGVGNRQSIGSKNTSDTFKAFQKAAQEKEQRERALREQSDLARQKKEQAERERKRIEHERRKEREEEEALEQARRAMMIHSHKETSASNANNQQDSLTTNKVPIGPSSGGSLHGGHDSPGSDEAAADRARQQREQLRKDEQERRRREAKANQIDMNRQSDLMAAFEENII